MNATNWTFSTEEPVTHPRGIGVRPIFLSCNNFQLFLKIEFVTNKIEDTTLVVTSIGTSVVPKSESLGPKSFD